MFKWRAPLDPSCPKVKRYYRVLTEDPMTKAMGAPVDEIMEHFERKHKAKCKRCQKFGVANIEVAE